MSKGDNSPGISRLAGVFQNLADKQVPKDLVLDFGAIQKNGSLLTNTFPVAIPKGDYQVCRHLKSHSATTSSKSVGDHGSHSHSVGIHEALKKGDRVLVAWVQNDAVVIDVLVEASSVL